MTGFIQGVMDAITGRKVKEAVKKNDDEHKLFKSTLEKLHPEDRVLKDIAKMMRQGQ